MSRERSLNEYHHSRYEVNLDAWRDLEDQLMRATTQASNTIKAYAHCWKHFERWCSAAKEPGPALRP